MQCVVVDLRKRCVSACSVSSACSVLYERYGQRCELTADELVHLCSNAGLRAVGMERSLAAAIAAVVVASVAVGAALVLATAFVLLKLLQQWGWQFQRRVPAHIDSDPSNSTSGAASSEPDESNAVRQRNPRPPRPKWSLKGEKAPADVEDLVTVTAEVFLTRAAYQIADCDHHALTKAGTNKKMSQIKCALCGAVLARFQHGDE